MKNTINTKLFRTILVVGSIFSAVMLWLTRFEWQNSLSAFASSQNAVWYNLMHVLAIGFFLINAFSPNRVYKKTIGISHSNMDIITGLGMGMILVTNMHLVYTWHVVFTVATLVIALINIVLTAPKVELWFRWLMVAVAVGSFLIGYLTPFHFLIGEVLAMSAITAAMLRQIWIYE